MSWCRDIQQGRSFYTGLGQTAARYDATLKKHLARAVQWAAGMVRGNCKATISSNYRTTRLTPPNPTTRRRTTPTSARSTAWRWPRTAACSTPVAPSASRASTQITNWTHAATSASAAARSTCTTRASTGTDDQNPAKVTKVADFTVFGAKGGGGETGDDVQGPSRASSASRSTRSSPRGARTSTSRTTRTTAASRATGHRPEPRPGLRPRRLHGRAPPVALHVRQTPPRRSCPAPRRSSTAS